MASTDQGRKVAKTENKPIKGFWIFDFDPEIFGFVFDKKSLQRVILAVVLFVFMRFIPIPGLGVEGRITFSILLGCMSLWTIKGMSKIPTCFLMLVLAITQGVMSYGDVVSTLGTTPFMMLFSMMIFAAGMTNTKMAERIAFFFLEKIGTSPFGILTAVFLTEVILSAFIANMPALIVVAAICLGILKEMGEVPGKSNFGTSLFVSITVGSVIGGLCFISSSGANPTAIAILETATEGACTITFNEWAAIGVPFALFLTPCCLFLVKFCFKINKNSVIFHFTKDELTAKRKNLGKMTNPEKRFISALVIMTALFLTTGITHYSVPFVSFIGLCMVGLPGIGCVNVRSAVKTLPWDVMFMAVANTIFAKAIAGSGLSSWVVDLLLGWAVNLPTLALLFVVAIVGVYMHYVSVSTPTSILIPAGVALAASTGLPPQLMFVPILFTSMCTVLMPIATDTMLTYEYGYWEFKDMVKAGNLIAIPWIIGGAIIPYLILPLLGIIW